MIKFLVDECIGPSLAKWLNENNYDAVSAYESLQSSTDKVILENAIIQQRILVTCDKDFGEMVFRNKMRHPGIILLRLVNDQPMNLIIVMQKILSEYTVKELSNNFIVATEKNVRIIKQF